MKLIVNEAIQEHGRRTGREAVWNKDRALSIRNGKHMEFGR
jgi:hypothetical protein